MKPNLEKRAEKWAARNFNLPFDVEDEWALGSMLEAWLAGYKAAKREKGERK